MNSTADQSTTASGIDLSVRIGRLSLPNPILVASGTFGYAREMEKMVDLGRLGGMVPKTITRQPRPGNSPWRTVETAAGLLNSIGLDNDGIDAFVEHHLPYLKTIGCPLVVSVAGTSCEDFQYLARKLNEYEGVSAIELNVSCPNVSGGVDFGSNPQLCHEVVSGVRASTEIPILAKLTPNVANIGAVAKAAEDAGADGLTVINTLLGMAVDWRRQKPMLGNVMGGLSGPAIKPVALRCVYQVSQAVSIPVVGVGGIATLDDVMEFLVAGATAIQLGTVNFYDPTISMRILDEMPGAVAQLGASQLNQVIGSLKTHSDPQKSNAAPCSNLEETRN
ncbi:MAG: dihydroorotate dehydrogenase [Planctomycetaceae bacterium]|nr:dihydroorotate dehydrogenase [Planctomycetaceae bacterium]